MTPYEQAVRTELARWQRAMQQSPSGFSRLSTTIQRRINRLIPQGIHDVITAAIKQMTRAVLYGAEYLTSEPATDLTLTERDAAVATRIDWYRKAGAAEGGVMGAGGFALALADFPLLLSLKMKLLFDIAALYGFRTSDYRERVFMLYVFQLAFSSQDRRQATYRLLADWQSHSQQLPDDINQFDWQTFQQEYRDYIDLAKLAQLIPGIGAAVGLVVNYRLISHLGRTAMNAYRMRLIAGSNAAGKRLI
ncbi:EcsC family protein [Spirosoma montaniterrae]|uniref:ABC transporter-associated protein EcsC n=1 Tax=Spirosoma montaniterrae TaxID=1178516 RepID=A0A1P9WSK5_9BACT|nr:EcsC family protein [Spirosoma montaniterrae]AQG78348.1 ABC transporter-associated protein EcsC [Spirosoma montaniterrae]